MRSPWKSFLVIGGLLVLAFAVMIAGVVLYHTTGRSAQERRAMTSMIKPLLESHADRAHVVAVLGMDFQDYSSGSTNQLALQRQPDIYSNKVRKASEQYSGVLFHTTAFTQIWLFFDSGGRLQQYYLFEQ